MQEEMNQAYDGEVVCLKHGSKMKDFCLKLGQGLMATAAHLYPKFPSVLSPTPFPSPPPPPID